MFVLLLIGTASVCADAVCGATDPYQCALKLVNQHELRAATATLRKLITAEPRDLLAQNLLGIVLLEAGSTEEAEKEFQKTIAMEPSFYPARKNLGIAQFTLGQFVDAKANFDEVLRNHPDEPIAALYSGELAYRSGDHARALFNFQKAATRILGVPAFTIHYADCLIRSGRMTEAVSIMQQINANAGEAHFAAGILLAREKNFAEAARCFHRSRERYSDPCIAGYNEALMDLRVQAYEKVVETVEGVRAGCKAQSELLNIEAAAYRNLNRVRDAYNALKQAAQLSPYEEQNYIDLADLCLDYNNFDLASEIIDLGLKSIPNSQRLYVHKGIMEAMRANFSKAETDFQFAADLVPNAILPKAALSLTWMATGEVSKAIETLRQCDKTNTTDFALPFLLGQALTRQGVSSGFAGEAEAIAAFEKAVRLNPQYAPAHAQLGKCLLRKGEEGRGVAELEEALRLDPQERVAAYQLAQIYRKQGNQPRALALLARVRNLNTEDRDQDLKRAMVLIVRQTHGEADSPKLNVPAELSRSMGSQ